MTIQKNTTRETNSKQEMHKSIRRKNENRNTNNNNYDSENGSDGHNHFQISTIQF